MSPTDLSNLKNQLRHAPSGDFILMIWALQMLWRGRVDLASRAVEIPANVARQRKETRFIVMPWNAISMLSIYLDSYDNLTDSNLQIRTLNVRSWNVISSLFNQLNSAANGQSMDDISNDADDLLEMMQRIMWQQFIWQRGHDNTQNIIRSSYINFTPKSKSVFNRRYRLSAEKFFTISFALSNKFQESPYFRDFDYFAPIGITKSDLRTYFKITSRTPKAASKQEKMIPGLKSGRADFRRNLIYDFPLFNVGDSITPIYMCPFPELLIYRATYFVYFDVMGATSKSFNKAIRKEAREAKFEMDKRFEEYCIDLLNAASSEAVSAEGDFQYGPSSKPRHSSDLMIDQEGTVVAVCECKAKKMKIDIRLSPRPVRDHLAEIAQISEGIVQLWRYAKDLRCGKVTKEEKTYRASSNLVGAVITLEEWADHSHIFYAECMKQAESINDESKGTDKHVAPEERIDVCIISAVQYEDMISKVPSEELQSYLRQFSQYQKIFDKNGFNFEGTIDEGLHRTHPLSDRLREILPMVDALKSIDAPV